MCAPQPSASIGALIIGQTPRTDLIEPVRGRLPGWDLRVFGALDGLTRDDVPDATGAAYPLTTRMGDGQTIKVGEDFLIRRLQLGLEELEGQGVVASLLLCAGTFGGLQGRRPVVKPFAVGCSLVQTLGLTRLGLIAPFPEQEAPIRRRWQDAGFEAHVWTGDLAGQDGEFHGRLQEQIRRHRLQMIVLDYVGHSPCRVEALRRASPVPVLDLGRAALDMLAAIVAQGANTTGRP